MSETTSLPPDILVHVSWALKLKMDPIPWKWLDPKFRYKQRCGVRAIVMENLSHMSL